MKLPSMMRAAVLRASGEPFVIEHLPVPVPRRGELLLKVHACGLCHSDLHVMSGHIAFPTPCVLGHEVSGEVVAHGPGVDPDHVPLGSHVVAGFLMPCTGCAACARGRDDLCERFFSMNRLNGTLFDGETRLATEAGEPLAMYSMGGLAEYCVVPSGALAVLPSGIDPVAAAVLGCAGLTAYGAVRRGADLRVGETAAIVAVGGVGLNIVQIARALGAREVIAIDIDDDNLALARQLGATAVINSRRESARDEVSALTEGRGVDVAFEALGASATWETALSVLADGGRMVPVGLGSARGEASVGINQLVRRSQSIRGSYGARTRTDLPAVVELAASGLLDYTTLVTQEVPLGEVNEAYERLRQGRVRGRIIAHMG